MDLRQMRQFVAVAEELHFGRAARRLNMEQPPLSLAIKRLENDLGVLLFDRSRRAVELTAPGRVLLSEARRILAQTELARKMVQREAVKLPEVRVSFIGPALYRVLPDLIVRFRAAQPDVHVRLFERPSPEQLQGVLAGEFDVGFVTIAGTAPGDGCETQVVERAPFLAAVPAHWELAKKDSISLQELAEQPFIVPPAQYAPYETLDMFKNAGLMPRVTQEATQTNTAISLVGAGLGCSQVVATASLVPAHNVRFLPITGNVSVSHWELLMIWRPKLINQIAEDFVRFVQARVQAMPEWLDAKAIPVWPVS